MGKQRYVWVLIYETRYFMGEKNCWNWKARWPRPNGSGTWLVFKTKEDAKDFLLDQYLRKGRNVSGWEPHRETCSKSDYRWLEKEMWGKK